MVRAKRPNHPDLFKLRLSFQYKSTLDLEDQRTTLSDLHPLKFHSSLNPRLETGHPVELVELRCTSRHATSRCILTACLLFLFTFTNETTMHIIFWKGTATNRGLSSEEADWRWEGSNPQPSCPSPTTLAVSPRLLSAITVSRVF